MKISIDELRSLPQQRATLGFKESIEGIDAVKPVLAELSVQANTTGIKVSGVAHTLLKRSCDRCLRPYFLKLSVPIDERFVECLPGNRAELGQKERELTSEDFVEYLSEDGELDITDVVYQAVTLATPATSLCGEDCPGPEFPAGQTDSASLARSKDSHKNDRIDPRWKNLKSLFPNEETDSKS